VFAAGNKQGHLLGQGGGGASGDPLAHLNKATAFITIGVSADRTFEAELEVVLGGARRRQRLVLPPDSRSPFMLNITTTENDQVIQGTALSFQGVIVSGHRLGIVGSVVRLLGP
jgi:hypothetical protein